MQVALRRVASVTPSTQRLSHQAIALLSTALQASRSRAWSLQLALLVANLGALTCEQAAALIENLPVDTPDRAVVAVALLPNVADLENVAAVEAAMEPDAVAEMQMQLGFASLFCAGNLSGRYHLDLSRQVCPDPLCCCWCSRCVRCWLAVQIVACA